MDIIIHALPADNGDYYIDHPVGSNSFILKRDDVRWKKAPAKNLKAGPSSVLVSEKNRQ